MQQGDLRWEQYGTDPQTDKSRGDKIDGNLKVFTVVYTAAARRVATLMRDGQAWHGAAAAALPHWLTWTSLELRGFVLLRRGASLWAALFPAFVARGIKFTATFTTFTKTLVM